MLPRNYPTYEDGIPVQIGDRAVIKGIECDLWNIDIYEDCFTLYGNNKYGVSFSESFRIYEHVKRAPEPDSWKKLEMDAIKPHIHYWECGNVICKRCPVKVDGKTPRERYCVDSCGEAKALDILARAKKLAGVE